MRLGHWIACWMTVLVTGCATGYHDSTITGGHSVKEMEPGIWRVSFAGNGFTTAETVQTYWLYRAAELTLEKGFDGFVILSNIQLVGVPSADPLLHLAKGGTFIYIPAGPSVAKPFIEADIRLLKQPFEPAPPKQFDATALKTRLEVYVRGEKCGANVCPHVHHYLRPDELKPDGAAPDKSS